MFSISQLDLTGKKNNFSDRKVQKSLDVQVTAKFSYDTFEDTVNICKDVLMKKQRLMHTLFFNYHTIHFN